MFEPHAITRARERYGINLSAYDLMDFAKRCCADEGLQERRADGRQFHMLVFGSDVLMVVYDPTNTNSTRPFGAIVTVMPSSVGAARSATDYEHMAKRRGEFGRLRKKDKRSSP